MTSTSPRASGWRHPLVLIGVLIIAAILVIAGMLFINPGGQNDLGASPVGSGPVTSPLPQYRTGERVKLDDEQFITVTEVAEWTGNDFVKPQPNQRLVTVNVSIEGIDPDGASVDPHWFVLEDDQFQRHDLIAQGKDPMLQTTDALAPGTQLTGWLTFSVPQNDSGGLDLIYAPPFAGPIRIDLR